ncbi:hypothetical protein [Metabacillus sediminilitoris]|uniref:Amidohydrolase 3 domain-containing protein n=1 Tax=Metabacillus sediminilitoris TaxID=2567941 RepID=A0A4S4BW45_9BACI|nr:hypothetical protein [Metabacillus sediminilitoris]QGQ46217.1 hypothetical protein GMB29_13910 [Metabacillus sediminilitoris]THF79270.1 hypothetical protein E6W99_13020 [Metabacillus sediminilitoris]
MFEGEADNYGLSTTTHEILEEAISEAREKGIHVSVHAMGDHAVDQIVNVFAKEEPWVKDAPTFHVEHAAMPTKKRLHHMWN